MKTIRVMLDDLPSTLLEIGRVGENEHTQVVINCIGIYADYPSALAAMAVQNPAGEVYPAVIETSGAFVVWTVCDSDLTQEGGGRLQLTFTDDEEIIKTVIGNTNILPSLGPTGSIPTPVENWLDQAGEKLAEIDAWNDAEAEATSLAAGASPTATITEEGGHKLFTFGIPKGDPAPAEDVTAAVDAYLAENFSNPSNPPLDRSLSSSSSAAPADMVGDLKSAVDDIDERFIRSKNIFDVSKITESYFVNQNTGALSYSTAFNVSDYIKIEPSTNYMISVQTLSTGTSAQIRYFQYDGSKTPIENSGGIDTTGKTLGFTSNSNAAYVRFSYVVYSSGVMLEKGSTATDYVPFYHTVNPEYIDSYTKTQSDARYAIKPDAFKVNLPDKLYATVGIEMNVYFDNVVDTHDVDYTFNIDCDKGMQMQRGYQYTPVAADVGNYSFTLHVTNKDGVTVEKTATLYVTAESVSPGKTVKIIVLGDSTTAGGITIEKIHADFQDTGYTVETLGTRGTSPNNHEGRSGWTATAYTNYAEIDGVTNPFYNNGFDATYYFDHYDIDFPDWFIINLGINDLFAMTTDTQAANATNTFMAKINSMISSIKAASSSIKIGLALTIPPNYSQDAFGKAYKCGQTRERYKKNNFYLVNTLIETYSGKEVSDGIYLIPLFTNLDTLYNMGFESSPVPVNARNTAITYSQPLGNGGVHPVESGYWQAADVYTAFIKANS